MRTLPIGSRDHLTLARRKALAGAREGEDALPVGLRGVHGAERVLALQRLVGNRATAAVLREPTRQMTDRDLKQEQRRDDRRDRGRREGDPLGGFDSDWAGRVLLEHYLFGGGDKLEFRDDSDWTGYMTRSAKLRQQNMNKVYSIVAGMLGQKKLGKIGVFERYHAQVENGEGVVGYQYLHGTNKTVGNFEIWGSGNVTKVNQAGVAVVQGDNPYAPDVAMHEAGTRIDLDLRFQWNDIIDPNGKYISDDIKSAIAELISFGQAEGYTFSVTWGGTCTVFVEPGKGTKVMGGYPKV